jgi:TPR repeat protein
LTVQTAGTKLLADEGDAAAEFVDGSYLHSGKGVDVDEVQACEYFKQPGEGGDSNGQMNYGNCLEYGKGISIDLREAALSYRWSADQGNAYGQRAYRCCTQAERAFRLNWLKRFSISNCVLIMAILMATSIVVFALSL